MSFGLSPASIYDYDLGTLELNYSYCLRFLEDMYGSPLGVPVVVNGSPILLLLPYGSSLNSAIVIV